MALWLRVEFESQHLIWLQPSVTPVLGKTVPSSGLHGHYTHGTNTCLQNTYTHKIKISKIKKIYFIIMGLCVCTWIQVSWRPKALDPLELEIQMVISHPLWVLRTKFKSSARAVPTLKCWDNSVANIYYFQCFKIFKILFIFTYLCVPTCL